MSAIHTEPKQPQTISIIIFLLPKLERLLSVFKCLSSPLLLTSRREGKEWRRKKKRYKFKRKVNKFTYKLVHVANTLRCYCLKSVY